jgi:hypothetical protein
VSEIKHTKGPWKATRSDRTKGADEWFITANIVDHNGERDICSTPGGASTSGGNARLIAAAPELYDALKYVVTIFEHYADTPEEINAIGLALNVLGTAEGDEGGVA